eukprot:TRINITY_DN205_c0_g1_i1.p1 TRINITY_DN205_c0_g1~~TRINITY_DN205_c0_g1_i1.p1  ORF type:complete len:345 (+),score=52.57 TRINITY_DN205_c0_g1_i1:85-1119(+)
MTMSPQQNRLYYGALYGSGIVVSLVLYGILQEKVMTQPYHEDIFEYSVFLVMCNRIAAVLFAITMALIYRESLVPGAPIWKYAVVSFANVYASSCQYEALKYVSFSVQMLGKSFKMMPVMLWGMAISGKRYGVKDWLVAAAVTGGVTMFLMTGEIESKTDTGNSARGLGFLGLFLFLDGLTSTFQEKLFKEHKTSKNNQMFYINFFSCLTSLATLLGSGSLAPSLRFCSEHPTFMRDVSLLSASAVSGQFFIYSQVKEFGALVFAITMNVRQIASILVSNVTYHHTTTFLQAWALCIVFATILWKSGTSLMEASPDEKKPLLDPQLKHEANAPEDAKEANASKV